MQTILPVVILDSPLYQYLPIIRLFGEIGGLDYFFRANKFEIFPFHGKRSFEFRRRIGSAMHRISVFAAFLRLAFGSRSEDARTEPVRNLLGLSEGIEHQF